MYVHVRSYIWRLCTHDTNRLVTILFLFSMRWNMRWLTTFEYHEYRVSNCTCVYVRACTYVRIRACTYVCVRTGGAGPLRTMPGSPRVMPSEPLSLPGALPSREWIKPLHVFRAGLHNPSAVRLHYNLFFILSLPLCYHYIFIIRHAISMIFPCCFHAIYMLFIRIKLYTYRRTKCTAVYT